MKCPHCLVEFFPAWQYQNVQFDVDSLKVGQSYQWKICSAKCAACSKLTMMVGIGANNKSDDLVSKSIRMFYPKSIARTPLSSDVPSRFSTDYLEAVAVFNDSAKASAALSRRCLQNLIHNNLGIKRRDLATEIQDVIDAKLLPRHLSEAIDGVRNIGNFAAHPIKSTSTGEIVDVEPGEAEWLLDTLEGLFDALFVEPAALQRKKDALNKKLLDAGKPPMK